MGRRWNGENGREKVWVRREEMEKRERERGGERGGEEEEREREREREREADCGKARKKVMPINRNLMPIMTSMYLNGRTKADEGPSPLPLCVTQLRVSVCSSVWIQTMILMSIQPGLCLSLVLSATTCTMKLYRCSLIV